MRSFLVLFLSFTFGTIYGESSPKSFNWGLADQNPSKQFVVDEKIWEKTATILLKGENEFNVLKCSENRLKNSKGPFQGVEIHRDIQTKNSSHELTSIWVDFHDDRVCWVRLNK